MNSDVERFLVFGFEGIYVKTVERLSFLIHRKLCFHELKSLWQDTNVGVYGRCVACNNEFTVLQLLVRGDCVRKGRAGCVLGKIRRI